MAAVVNVLSAVSKWVDAINPSTLTGAIDVIVVQSKDGQEMRCSPFHVRFGKLKLLLPAEKVVSIAVNGNPTPLQMKVGEAGEAFFVVETENPVPSEYVTSPLASAQPTPAQLDEMDQLELPITASRPQSPSAMALEIEGQTLTSSLESSHGHDLGALLSSRVRYSTAPQMPSIDEDGSSPFVRIPSQQSFPHQSESSSTLPTPTMPPNHHRSSSTPGTHYPFSMSTSTSVSSFPPLWVDANRSTSDPFLTGVDETGEVTSPETPMLLVPGGEMEGVGGESHFGYAYRPSGPRSHTDVLSPTRPLSDTEVDAVLGRFGRGGSRGGRGSPDNDDLAERDPLLQSQPSPVTLSLSNHGPSMLVTSPSNQYSWRWGALPTRTTPASPQLAGPVVSMASASTLPAGAGAGVVDGSAALESSPLPTPPVGEVVRPGLTGRSATVVGVVHNTLDGTAEAERMKDPVVDEQLHATSSDEHKSNLVEGTSPSTPPKLEAKPEVPLADPAPIRSTVEISMCGQLEALLSKGSEAALNQFTSHLISYDMLASNPSLLSNPELVLRIDGVYMTWASAAPHVLSIVAFGKPLNVAAPDQGKVESANVSDPKKKNEQTSTTSSGTWWPWGGGTTKNAASAPKVDTKLIEPKASSEDKAPLSPPVSPSLKPSEEAPKTETADAVPVTPLPHKPNYAKSLRLTSDQLKSLNLKKGINSVAFSVQSDLLGTSTTYARIFFWDWDARIIISDVDGTITKSDALGHLLNALGRDWTHTGIAELYSRIANNGFHFLYLTARAIGQASTTRDYIAGVKQGSAVLPVGPVVMSPDRLFQALHREVVRRKPEEFKIAVLRDMRKLFPEDHNPFFAGFGNRMTDAFSYRSVNVPASRIFTIDPNGKLKFELLPEYNSSYPSLSDIVDHIFPPSRPGAVQVDTEFTDLDYWRQPVAKMDFEDLIAELNGKPKNRTDVSVYVPEFDLAVDPLEETFVGDDHLLETDGMVPEYEVQMGGDEHILDEGDEADDEEQDEEDYEDDISERDPASYPYL
ncbi:LNS2-domain-containing protein [Gonapodya prolifera JEL478]|uniref:phosphatidate phosphatase n=1 Tax=Gonapodya prolifera (strain JEL478) TaxID=1344416 RepID=A0A139A476_GONPJ|nr:LNS2-domain-containing protein [Gonapodya prolifera JEL478]|eukprot:KXS11479.1 LNS2-domain-containing protein [Gonapodya prolifera JEL478]